MVSIPLPKLHNKSNSFQCKLEGREAYIQGANNRMYFYVIFLHVDGPTRDRGRGGGALKQQRYKRFKRCSTSKILPYDFIHRYVSLAVLRTLSPWKKYKVEPHGSGLP